MVSFKGEPLAELGNRGGKDGRNPAIPLVGGERPVGEKEEGVEAHL